MKKLITVVVISLATIGLVGCSSASGDEQYGGYAEIRSQNGEIIHKGDIDSYNIITENTRSQSLGMVKVSFSDGTAWTTSPNNIFIED